MSRLRPATRIPVPSGIVRRVGSARTFTVAVPPGGLANRLLTILQAYSLAMRSGRQLRVCWEPSKHCGARWGDLFQEAPFPVLESRESIRFDFHVRYEVEIIRPADFFGVLAGPAEHVALRQEWLWWDPGSHSVDALPRLIDVIFRLRPELAAAVEAFRSRHFKQPMTAVHVRRGDLGAWLAHGRPRTEEFIEAVRRRGPAETVFLSTDDGAPDRLGGGQGVCNGVVEAFSKAFGPRLTQFSKRREATLLRDHSDNTRDAVCDLWLLRAGTALVGTANSTFSRFAALNHGRPVLL